MESLSTYVAAIHRQAGPVGIATTSVAKSSWRDQGFEVTKEVTDYHFDNGAVIRRTVEQDNFSGEAACTECWITYEVLSPGHAVTAIRPARQVFENACRESFWLTYHTA